jgi:DNA-binding IclR family transcriptional regulator
MSSLENGLAILALVSEDRPLLRVGEVCRQLQLPKASVSRLMRTLSQFGMLERAQGSEGYVVGPRAILLGHLFMGGRSLTTLIDEAMTSLVGEFGFTGYISVLTGRDIVLLRVQQGSYPLRHVRAAGTQLPSWRTTMGHSLLSRLPTDDVRKRLAGATDDAGAIDIDAVLAKLAETRQAGIAAGGSVLTPGITTVSVAILAPGSGDLMACAIAFPNSAADPELRRRIMDSMLRRAAAMGQAVGDPDWTKAAARVQAKRTVRVSPD